MEKIVNHFEDRKFRWVDGAPLVAHMSTTVPFCISGGVPYEAIIAGDEPPTMTQFANMQTCIRTARLDGIGYTGRHHICFDMLGHFMLGVANALETKTQMIQTAHSFLVSLGFEKERIAATVDTDDVESQKIWTKLGVKLFAFSNKKVKEARRKRSGYQTEILYRIRDGCDFDAYCELWNNVIYQFATPDFVEPLQVAFADSGVSWDRIVSALDGVTSNYQNSLWKPYLSVLDIDSSQPEFCRIAEFVKATTYLSAEPNFYPSNKAAGYEFRKLIRKMFALCEEQALDWYDLFKKTDLYFSKKAQHSIVVDEISKFKNVLLKGYTACKKSSQPYSDELANFMYESRGFPKDLFAELKQKGGIPWVEKLMG